MEREVQGSSTKLHQGRFGLDIRKNFFTVRVPREVVDAPGLAVFKRHLDNASIICFHFWLAMKWSGS